MARVYGPQHWWPAETPLEVVIGAYLTQNTSWRGVEHSLENLRSHGLLPRSASDADQKTAAAGLLALPDEELRTLLRPSGYMVRKSAAVRAFLGFLFAEAEGSMARLQAIPPEKLRPKLLALPGVGPETADAILLYALNQPAMVVDEYLRRVMVRHGLAPEKATYDELQALAWSALAGERGKARVEHANEFHALIVMVGKEHCAPTPRCGGCPLASFPALLRFDPAATAQHGGRSVPKLRRILADMGLLHGLLHALEMAALMGWQMLWALVLGFALSAVVQATVSRERVAKLMPDSGPRSLAIAAGLGAASSSCSYAAVALARTLFRKGADFRAAMAFEFASTNLVFELGLTLLVLLGWRFAAAEFLGGPIMIVLLALMMRVVVRRRMVDTARQQAERGLLGRMEGHAAMDMSAKGATWGERLRSPEVFTAISNIFVMEWAAVLGDIALGLLLSGCIAAWVPTSFWQRFFLVGHPALALWWGPFAGPLVALVSFVCSVGNVPLAAVLWQHGLSFGGVVAFLFGDLIILPIVNIHRKYYGWRMAITLLALYYVAMAGAALLVEGVFAALHLTPHAQSASMTMQDSFRWDHTAVLNIVFLALAAMLVTRFLRSGGAGMLRHMDEPMDDHAMHGEHSHGSEHDAGHAA